MTICVAAVVFCAFVAPLRSRSYATLVRDSKRTREMQFLACVKRAVENGGKVCISYCRSLSLCLCLCLSVFPSVFLSVSLSFFLSFFLSLYLSLSSSLFLSFFFLSLFLSRCVCVCVYFRSLTLSVSSLRGLVGADSRVCFGPSPGTLYFGTFLTHSLT